MTLILSCITRKYVLQVSDRRLVDLFSGMACEEKENKAVDFSGHLAFGYTGLAKLIDGIPTDLWLGRALLGTSTVGEAVEAVRVKATDCFRKINTAQRAWKRHAFVGCGWIQLSPTDPLRPCMCMVSNFHDEAGQELSQPLDEFVSTVRYLQDSAPRPFFVSSVGQPVDRDIARNLNRCLSRCLRRRDELGPKPLLRLLIHAMREVAKHNSKVGKNLLAVSIPLKAVHSSFLPMPDGSLGLFSLSSQPLKGMRSFLYIAEGQAESEEYGPVMVYGHSMLRGYFVSASPDRSNLDVSAVLEELEPGAKGGLILTDDRIAGQFIALNPSGQVETEDIEERRLKSAFKRGTAAKAVFEMPMLTEPGKIPGTKRRYADLPPDLSDDGYQLTFMDEDGMWQGSSSITEELPGERSRVLVNAHPDVVAAMKADPKYVWIENVKDDDPRYFPKYPELR